MPNPFEPLARNLYIPYILFGGVLGFEPNLEVVHSLMSPFTVASCVSCLHQLPRNLGGDGRNRTGDLRVMNPSL